MSISLLDEKMFKYVTHSWGNPTHYFQTLDTWELWKIGSQKEEMMKTGIIYRVDQYQPHSKI